MKRIALFGIVLLAVTALIGCGQQSEPAPQAAAPAQTPVAAAAPAAESGAFADGIYFAMEDDYASSGWKYVVSFKVEQGNFVWADWNGVHRDSGPDKKTLDKMGGYQMVARGGALDEWYVQAERTEAYLLETQDPSAISYTSDRGHTDDISRVTIRVVEFYDLVDQALAEGPIGPGAYEDGIYFTSAQAYSGNWRSTVAFNVINGYIAGVNWSAVDRNGRDKKTVDRDGGYQMVARGGAIDEWYVQARRVEKLLVDTQDPAIPYDDGGYTDAVSGVTIHIDDFVKLVQASLDNGPVEYPDLADGVYSAEADEYASSGWKGNVTLTVVNGFIADVNWSATHRDGRDKKTVDLEGDYQMVARGGAIDEWYIQAQRVENELLRTQSTDIPYDDGGYTDAVSGVTIHIDEFVVLAEQAIEQAR